MVSSLKVWEDGTDDDGQSSEDSSESTSDTTEGTKVTQNTEDASLVESINMEDPEGKFVFKKSELTEDYDGKPAIRLYFDYTNLKDDVADSSSICNIQVFQNGVEKDTTYQNDSTDEDDNLYKEIQKELYELLKNTENCFLDYDYNRSDNQETYTLSLSWDDLLCELGMDSHRFLTGSSIYKSVVSPFHFPRIELNKYILSNENVVYSVEIGDECVNVFSQYDYMLTGADIYYDRKNKVTTLIDDIMDRFENEFSELKEAFD